jgi:hypothetical protein
MSFQCSAKGLRELILNPSRQNRGKNEDEIASFRSQ